MSALCIKFHRSADSPILIYNNDHSVNMFPTAADGLEAVAEADHSQYCHDTGELTAADNHQLVGQCSQL